ncbi:MAG: class I SAM-dependent methyltransferase [Rubrobacteraceae bacterium]
MPNERLLDFLELSGGETMVDYGADSGILTILLARALRDGTVHAVDESTEMMRLLRERVESAALVNVETHLIRENRVPLGDGVADRVLAVNLLHEVVGKTALAEMRRLLLSTRWLLARRGLAQRR